LEKKWKLSQSLRDLPDVPVFRFNSTTYESGKNWRFSKEKMGDYLTGYIENPDFPLSSAVAASAAFPGLIGPLRMNRKGKSRRASDIGNAETSKRLKDFDKLWLWDGGVYENLAVESLYKNRNLQKNLSFLVVSDASGQLGVETRRWGMSFPYFLSPFRLINIATDQIRSLRARDLIACFTEHPELGRYLYISNSVPEIYKRAGRPQPMSVVGYQDEQIVAKCSRYPTNLRRMTVEDYDHLSMRGYEVARATFACYSA
jgi:NTE family protein